MKLAVFDLDHTLMPMDTSGSWVIWMTAASGLRLEPVLSAVRKFDADYDAGRLDIDEFMATQMQWLARFRRAHLERVREAFTKCWLAPNVPQASLDLVESHRTAGGTCVAVNASPELAAEADRRGWKKIATYTEEMLARAMIPAMGAQLYPEVFRHV